MFVRNFSLRRVSACGIPPPPPPGIQTPVWGSAQHCPTGMCAHSHTPLILVNNCSSSSFSLSKCASDVFAAPLIDKWCVRGRSTECRYSPGPADTSYISKRQLWQAKEKIRSGDLFIGLITRQCPTSVFTHTLYVCVVNHCTPTVISVYGFWEGDARKRKGIRVRVGSVWRLCGRPPGQP